MLRSARAITYARHLFSHCMRTLGLCSHNVRVPTRLQFQTTECGVAALAMILAYHGRHVSNEELRTVTGVSRDCVNAAEIARAARHYGLECKAYTREPFALANLPRPFLAHMRFIHFVVVEGIHSNEVLMNEPDAGRSRIPMDRFNEEFTGVVLTFRPGPGFERQGSAVHPVLALWHRLAGCTRLQIAATTGAALVAALLVPALAIAIGKWADTTHLQSVTTAQPAALAAAALALLCTLVLAIRGHLLASIRRQIEFGEARLLARRFLSLPTEFFVYRVPAKLLTTLYAGETVAKLCCQDVLPALLRLLTLPVGIIALACLHPPAAVVVTVICALCIVSALVVFRQLGHRTRVRDHMNAEQFASSHLARDELERAKLLTLDRDFVNERLGERARIQKFEQEAGTVDAPLHALTTVCTLATIAAAVVLAADAVTGQGASTGDATALILLAAAMAAPLRGLPGLLTAWDRLTHILLPVDDVLACPLAAAGPTPPAAAAHLPDDLVLRARNISFGYSTRRPPLLSDIDISLVRGEQLGLTGPSGGGKSTLAGLLAGDHKPWTGLIEFAASGTKSSPNTIVRADKSSFFFEGTVRENLCLWDDNVPAERLERAVSDACLDEVLAAREAGIDSMVMHGARNFSGGQRQRMEIARALLREPGIVVLDEATDALDPALEARIRDNIRRRGCSLIMVSHRASSLAACDRVLRMAAGRIVTRDGEITPVAEESPAAQPAGPPAIATDPTTPRPELPALHAALRRAAQTLGLQVTADAGQVAETTPSDITQLAPQYALHVREVRFVVRKWWSRHQGILIAFRHTTHAPVVMLPAAGGYRCIDPVSGLPVPLHPEHDLLPAAWHVYPRESDSTDPIRQRFRQSLHLAWKDLATAGAASILLGACFALLPALAAHSLDPASPSRAPWMLVAGIVSLLLSAGLLAYCRTLASLRALGRLGSTIVSVLVQRLPRLTPGFLRRVPEDVLGQGLAALKRLLNRVRGEALPQAFDMGVVIVMVGMLAWLDSRLAVPATVLGLVMTLTPVLLARRGLAIEPMHTLEVRTSRRFLLDVLAGIRRLRLLASEQSALEQWLSRYAGDVKREQPLRAFETRNAWLPESTPWLVFGLFVLLVPALLQLPPAILPAVLLSLGLMTDAALGAGFASLALLRTRLPQIEADRLATAPLEPRPAAGRQPIPSVELRNVSYCYHGISSLALRQVSLRMVPGEFLALTGPSGGGKSTLLRLIVGLDDPQSGEILFNGSPAAAARVRWRQAVGMVSQDERIGLASTLRSQISGLAPCGVSEVWRATQNVLLAADISRMPMGLQTIVETGMISTGQEQRLLIARELLRRPSLLILDEATNAIPDALQAELFANLRRLGVACILVTHRETALSHMDRVVVVEHGTIAWSGTPAELHNERRLVDMLQAERQEGHL